MKTNISDINNISLENLPITKDFNWKHDENKLKTSGYIAQDLLDTDEFKRFVETDTNGMYKVNYTSLLSYEVEILKRKLK